MTSKQGQTILKICPNHYTEKFELNGEYDEHIIREEINDGEPKQ